MIADINLFAYLLLIGLTLMIYIAGVKIQTSTKLMWLNPMLLSIAMIIPLMLWQDMAFSYYFNYTKPLSDLLEPAVVALGFPLYQHLKTMKRNWRVLLIILSVGVFVAVAISFVITMAIVAIPEVAVALSYKSVTTPIGIALTDSHGGNSAVTAFAIILAGIFGALLGPSWLNFIKIKSAKAQGLAVGAASHALGTATVCKLSYEHGAFSSLSLIVSAVITALIGPIIVSTLLSVML